MDLFLKRYYFLVTRMYFSISPFTGSSILFTYMAIPIKNVMAKSTFINIQFCGVLINAITNFDFHVHHIFLQVHELEYFRVISFFH